MWLTSTSPTYARSSATIQPHRRISRRCAGPATASLEGWADDGGAHPWRPAWQNLPGAPACDRGRDGHAVRGNPEYRADAVRSADGWDDGARCVVGGRHDDGNG